MTRFISHLDRSTDSGSIESAHIFSLTDHSGPSEKSPLQITLAVALATTKKDMKSKTWTETKADG